MGQFTDWHLQVTEQVAAMSLCTDCVLLMTKLPHVMTWAVIQRPGGRLHSLSSGGSHTAHPNELSTGPVIKQ